MLYMPTWTRNILQTLYTKSTEKNVFKFEFRKLTAECGCMITYNINQFVRVMVKGRKSGFLS